MSLNSLFCPLLGYTHAIILSLLRRVTGNPKRPHQGRIR